MRIRRFLVVTACIVGSCAILAFVVPGILWNAFLRDMLFTPIPSSAVTPPIYPNAQQVKVQDLGNGSKDITFVTSAKPEDVLSSYKNSLRKDGWFNPLEVDHYPANVFEWHQAGPDGPTDTAFRLTLTTKPAVGGGILVELYLLEYDPR